MNNEKILSVLSLSLLYPSGYKKDCCTEIEKQSVIDLGFTRIIESIADDSKIANAVRKPLNTICSNPEIINYRLDVLDDMFSTPDLADAMEGIIPGINRLRFYIRHPGKTDATPFQESLWRLRELENYVYCITRFKEAFIKGGTPRSQGLIRFKEAINRIAEDKAFKQLQEQLPDLLANINEIKSITIGVNLNRGFIPIEAVLLEVNSEPFQKQGFLDKVMPSNRSVGKLHTSDDAEFHGDPSMVPLLQDLGRVLNCSVKPLQKALKKFSMINGVMLLNLLDEFVFYLYAYTFLKKLRNAGLPMVRPKIYPKEKTIFKVSGMYNLDLAVHMIKNEEDIDTIVSNSLDLQKDSRLAILTGPNSGGKTIFLQAVGLVQIMAGLGLYVPAASAEISLCSNVYTHYPSLEDSLKDAGRFGEEAERLRDTMLKADAGSLLLLNESLSSTSMGEALFIAEDLFRIFHDIGCKIIFATHLHELAIKRDTVFDNLPAVTSRIQSLVAGTQISADGSLVPNYNITPGEPQGRSYAQELARRYSLTRDNFVPNGSAV